MNKQAPSLPVSATHQAVALSGFVCFLTAYLYLLAEKPFASMVHYALFLMGAISFGILIPDILFRKNFCSKAAGFSGTKTALNPARVFTKCAGLYGVVGVFVFAHFVFPEYSSSYYAYFYDFFKIIVLPWAILSPFYIAYVDRRLEKPEDDLWHLGKLFLFQWNTVDFMAARREFLRWMIKAFFAPLMVVYMCGHASHMLNPAFLNVSFFQENMPMFFAEAMSFSYFIDTCFVTTAYVMCFKVFDTHIRSPEPSFFGWAIAVACYPPFNRFLNEHYWSHKTDYTWLSWLDTSSPLFYIWGGAILFYLVVYAWTTVLFGLRFSNLTHRGIITSGPYRWTKHPHYLFKNMAWWLISVPFLGRETAWQSVAHCSGLLLVNYIYYLRAKTEERHLSQDPVYRDYMAWIDAHGIFRFVNKLPLLGRLAQLKLKPYAP